MTYREETIGDCRLLLGDCREILPTLGKVDAVVTDPPYGMDWDVDHSRFRPGKNGHGKSSSVDWGVKIHGDAEPFDPAPFLGFDEVILFGCNHFAARLPVGTTLVWIKRMDNGFGSFLSDAEIAWQKGGHGVYCRRDTSMMAETLRKVHPTQKPAGVMEWCIERTNAGTILDPFMGSGTTGVACVKLGRKFIGIEIEEKYFDIACKRIRDAYNQPDLFIESAKPQPPQQLDLMDAAE